MVWIVVMTMGGFDSDEEENVLVQEVWRLRGQGLGWIIWVNVDITKNNDRNGAELMSP